MMVTKSKFESTTKVPAERLLKYDRTSACTAALLLSDWRVKVCVCPTFCVGTIELLLSAEAHVSSDLRDVPEYKLL